MSSEYTHEDNFVQPHLCEHICDIRESLKLEQSVTDKKSLSILLSPDSTGNTLIKKQLQLSFAEDVCYIINQNRNDFLSVTDCSSFKLSRMSQICSQRCGCTKLSS